MEGARRASLGSGGQPTASQAGDLAPPSVSNSAVDVGAPPIEPRPSAQMRAAPQAVEPVRP